MIKLIFGLFAHLMATVATLHGLGGLKAVVAPYLLLKQQLLMLLGRQRAPNLTALQCRE